MVVSLNSRLESNKEEEGGREGTVSMRASSALSRSPLAMYALASFKTRSLHVSEFQHTPAHQRDSVHCPPKSSCFLNRTPNQTYHTAQVVQQETWGTMSINGSWTLNPLTTLNLELGGSLLLAQAFLALLNVGPDGR